MTQYEIEAKIERLKEKLESAKSGFDSANVARDNKTCPRFGHLWENVEEQIANAESKVKKAIEILADAIDTCQMIARAEDQTQDEEE